MAVSRFAELRLAHVDVVFAYTRRRLPQSEDAEDVVVEVFAAAYLTLWRCPKDDRARAWLLAIARHKIADWYRKRGRDAAESLTDVSLPKCSRPTPEQAALATEEASTLRRAILSLTDDQREALLLKYVDGLTVAEVARVLNKSEASVQSLLQRARAAVQARAAYYFQEETETHG